MTAPKILGGMESQDADDLQKELAKWGEYYSSRRFPDALYKLDTPPETEKKISTYLEVLFKFRIFNSMLRNENQKAKDHATTILNTTSDKLSLENSFLAVYSKRQKPGPGLTTPANKAVVILALGKLDRENGLPLFQVSMERGFEPFGLESGDMLAVPPDTHQYFEGSGGGLVHISIWVHANAAS